MTDLLVGDHDGLRWWVVRRPGIAVSLTAAIVDADPDGRIAAMMTTVRDRDGKLLIPDSVTVHRPGQDRSCPALPSGCSMGGEREPGAPEARLLAAYEADACQPHSIADGLVEILHRETGEATDPAPPPERVCRHCGATDNLKMLVNPLGLIYKSWECRAGCPTPPLDLDALERLAAEAGLPWQRWPGPRRPWMLIAAADTDVVAEVHESSETGPLTAYIVAAANALPELSRAAREAERLVHLGALRHEEIEKLRAEVLDRGKALAEWQNVAGQHQAALFAARAELERLRPVVDAAREWVADAHEAEGVAASEGVSASFDPEDLALIAAVDALDADRPTPPEPAYTPVTRDDAALYVHHCGATVWARQPGPPASACPTCHGSGGWQPAYVRSEGGAAIATCFDTTHDHSTSSCLGPARPVPVVTVEHPDDADAPGVMPGWPRTACGEGCTDASCALEQRCADGGDPR